MSTTSNSPIGWQTKPDQNAPLTGHAWIERFANAMEQRGASARTTGDAIADSHAREANRPTGALFGGPEAYARELLPRRRFPWRRWFALSGWAFCFTLAMLSAVPLMGSEGPSVRLSSWWWLAVLTAVFLCYAASAGSTWRAERCGPCRSRRA